MNEVKTQTKTKKKADGLTIILIIMIVLTVLVLALKIIGVRTFTVTSGSMRPAIEIADAVIVVPIDFEDLKEGDIVTFLFQGRNSTKPSTITHRVYSIDRANREILTKGDNNNSTDGTSIPYDFVVGKVMAILPGCGEFLSYFSSTAGKIMLISLLLLVFVLIVFFTDGKKPKEPAKEPDGENAVPASDGNDNSGSVADAEGESTDRSNDTDK